MCKDKYAANAGRRSQKAADATVIYDRMFIKSRLTKVRGGCKYGINNFTFMPTSDANAKRKSLQATGTFNPRADHVQHRLFKEGGFFDPKDLIQLKYETLRSVQADGYSISQAAEEFGLSRPTIYQAQAQLEQRGMEGLLPHQRGPKKPHKLTNEVMDFLQGALGTEPEVSSAELARRVLQRFGATIHPRTIEKALKSKAKRGRPKTT
jgi:transposase